MHPLRSAALRIAVGAALSFGLYVLASSASSSTATTAYAVDATPMPASIVTPPSPSSPVTPPSPASPVTPPLPASPATPPPPASPVTPASAAPTAPSPAQIALQQTSDQIAAVSQQITQAIQDPSTSVDSKVQLINGLSAQFNQLVSIWQQQLAQVLTAPPAVAGVQVTPTPTIPASPTPKPGG